MLDWLLTRAREAAAYSGREWDPKLETIITFCASNPETFARGNLDDLFRTKPAELTKKISACVDRYYRERESVLALSPVKTVPDPAVNVALEAFAAVPESDVESMVTAHRISMSAENLIGSLLERYVAGYLESIGWIWCCGNIIRAVDFLKTSPRERLLQIKNRDNSENSSSSAIRSGTTIEKWYRISSLTDKTHWSRFPENEQGEYLTEDGFLSFVRDYAEHMKSTP